MPGVVAVHQLTVTWLGRPPAAELIFVRLDQVADPGEGAFFALLPANLTITGVHEQWLTSPTATTSTTPSGCGSCCPRSTARTTPTPRRAPGPLQELLNRIGGQVAVVRRSIDRLWADQSIETCDDWVIPYIGDLLGTNLVNGLDARGQRLDVAKTIHYRRRKGTLAVLEELARDVTGWDAHVVEGFRRLARTRHGLDPDGRAPRPSPGSSPADVARAAPARGTDGPADRHPGRRHGRPALGPWRRAGRNPVRRELPHGGPAGRAGCRRPFRRSRSCWCSCGGWRASRSSAARRCRWRAARTCSPSTRRAARYRYSCRPRQTRTTSPTPGRPPTSGRSPGRSRVPRAGDGRAAHVAAAARTRPAPEADPPPPTGPRVRGDWQPTVGAGRRPAASRSRPPTRAADHGRLPVRLRGNDRGRPVRPPAARQPPAAGGHRGIRQWRHRPRHRPRGRRPAGRTVTITDSRSYGQLADVGSTVAPITAVLVAAGPQLRPVLRPRRLPRRGPWIFTGAGQAELALDGLLVSGCDIVLRGSFDTVRLTACTMDPGTAAPGSPPLATAADGRRLGPARSGSRPTRAIRPAPAARSASSSSTTASSGRYGRASADRSRRSRSATASSRASPPPPGPSTRRPTYTTPPCWPPACSPPTRSRPPCSGRCPPRPRRRSGPTARRRRPCRRRSSTG